MTKATMRNVQPEVLYKLTAQYMREGLLQPAARMRAQDDLQRLATAGVFTLPCTVHQFIERAGLAVLNPEDAEKFEALIREGLE
jgi:hypothetical protein